MLTHLVQRKPASVCVFVYVWHWLLFHLHCLVFTLIVLSFHMWILFLWLSRRHLAPGLWQLVMELQPRSKPPGWVSALVALPIAARNSGGAGTHSCCWLQATDVWHNRHCQLQSGTRFWIEYTHTHSHVLSSNCLCFLSVLIICFPLFFSDLILLCICDLLWIILGCSLFLLHRKCWSLCTSFEGVIR